MTHLEMVLAAHHTYAELGGPKSKPARLIRAQQEEIKRLREHIAREGVITNTCTFNALREICEGCNCSRRHKTPLKE